MDRGWKNVDVRATKSPHRCEWTFRDASEEDSDKKEASWRQSRHLLSDSLRACEQNGGRTMDSNAILMRSQKRGQGLGHWRKGPPCYEVSMKAPGTFWKVQLVRVKMGI